MPLRLRVLPSVNGSAAGETSGPTQERAVELPDDTREIRIGRRSDIEVPLPYASLSGLHARLTRTATGWQAEDLDSTNGTRLDGQPLAPHRPRPIGPGAQIELGPVLVVFDGAAPAVRGSERTASIARRLVADLLAGSPDAGAPVLAIVDGVPPGPPLRLTAIDKRYVIGRGESCDMRLSSDEISREHVAVVRRWEGVVVQDLGSKNGITVIVQTGTAGGLLSELRVRDGDLVRVGPATLRLSDPADRYLREIEAQAADEAARETATGLAPVPSARSPARPPVRRPPSPALRAAIAVATGVLVMVVLAIVMLAVGGTR